MWNIDFISKKDFKEHVRETIKTYDETLKKIDLYKFNSNIIDPIKLLFDSKVYQKTYEEVIESEMVRQRDKTNTNAIGYFHQNIFKYFHNCIVPSQGFDVIYTKNNYEKIYIEMKNKHNTMNSSSSQKTYMKMLNQLLIDPRSVCYLVEVIAKTSQNIVWKVTLDKQKMANDRIRRVSIDKLYTIVTGDENAFYKMCMVLPEIIDEILEENKQLYVEKDTVIEELYYKNKDLLKSLYLLAFKDYDGFEQLK